MRFRSRALSMLFALTLLLTTNTSVARVESDDAYRELLTQAIDGISFSNAMRQPMRDVTNGAELVFINAEGAWPFSVRLNDEEWLRKNWLESEMGEIKRTSLGMGSRSMVLVGSQRGQSLCAAVVIMDDVILMTGLGREGGMITDAEEERVIGHVRTMYTNLGGTIASDGSAGSGQRDDEGSSSEDDGASAPRRAEESPTTPRRSPDASSSPKRLINPSSGSSLGRANARQLGALHKALINSGADRNGMPDSSLSLMKSGAITDPLALRDLRSWPVLFRVITGQPIPDDVATHRLGGRWREGAVATSDLPRRGHWLVLNGDGSVDMVGAGAEWLGTYEARPPSEASRRAFLGTPGAALGVYLSNASSSTGRAGLGVDAVIPGYRRSAQDGSQDEDLRPGDLILTADGARVASLDDLHAMMERRDVSDNTAFDFLLEIVRDGQLMTVRSLQPGFEHFSAESVQVIADDAQAVLEMSRRDAKEAEHIYRRWLQVRLGLLDFNAALETFDEYMYESTSRDLVSAALMVVEYTEGRDAVRGVLDLAIERAESDGDRDRARIRRAYQHLEDGEFDEVFRCLEPTEIRHLQEANLAVVRELGPNFEDTAEARDIFKSYAEEELMETWSLYCVALARSGKTGEFFQRLDAVLPLHRDPVDLCSRCFEPLVEIGRIDDAIALTERALQLEDLDDRMRPELELFIQRMQVLAVD